MNLNPVLQTITALPARLKQRALGMFNLNDPRWGRDEDKSPPAEGGPKPEARPEDSPAPPPPRQPQPRGANQGPPDLDELWRDFNRKLSGFLGGIKGGDYSIMSQLFVQAEGVVITMVWSAIVAYVAFKIVDMLVGLRVTEEEEREGLDISSHGESAYHG